MMPVSLCIISNKKRKYYSLSSPRNQCFLDSGGWMQIKAGYINKGKRWIKRAFRWTRGENEAAQSKISKWAK